MMNDIPSNWAEPFLAAKKKLSTAEACCTLHLWDQARDAINACAEMLKVMGSATLLMESEHLRMKYERGGYVVYRLKDCDVVAAAGVCPYCGAKGTEHSEACAMWCPG